MIQLLALTTGAPHLCAGFGRSARPKSEGMKDFLDAKGFRSGTLLNEGTADFDEMRDCMLRETEGSLFIATALMRWSHSIMAETASHWAQTTLYYASFHAAKSILGTQGGWYDGMSWVVESNINNPGSQQFTVRKWKDTTGTRRGSHQKFWDEYYDSVAGLAAWLDPALASAIHPTNGDNHWLTDSRNLYNYVPAQAFAHMAAFKAKFSAATFPASLNTELATQFEVSRAMLGAAFKIGKDCVLKTDVVANRRTDLEATVFNAVSAELGAHVTSLGTALLV